MKKNMKRYLFVAILFLILLVLPFCLPESIVYLLGLMFLFILYVVSWDIVAGYTGQINLGHTVFIGIGGYTTALLQNSWRFTNFMDFLASLPPLPIWLTILLGGVNALITGLIVGIICLRLRGYYLALVTAVLPLICIQLVNIYSPVFGGYEGFSIGFGKSLAQRVIFRYYFSMTVCVVSLLVLYFILKSKIGVKFKAIREDEELAESVGMNVVKYKLLAFCISAFFAGIAGAVAVHYRLTVGTDLFDIPLMLMIILSAIIGGLGSFHGVILGSVIIYLLKNWIIKNALGLMRLEFPDEIILYFLLIILILKAPRGIIAKLSELTRTEVSRVLFKKE